MKNKNTIISITVSVVLIIFAIIITSNNNIEKQEIEKVTEKTQVNNVSIVGDKQIIEITAKGGYNPRKSIAKSGIQTILRFNTKGTFDCSSSVRIPSMNILKNLPQSGITDIDLGINNIGILYGTCGMGMYPFEIEFE